MLRTLIGAVVLLGFGATSVHGQYSVGVSATVKEAIDVSAPSVEIAADRTLRVTASPATLSAGSAAPGRLLETIHVSRPAPAAPATAPSPTPAVWQQQPDSFTLRRHPAPAPTPDQIVVTRIVASNS
jgi:hypothetical protein